MKRVAVTRVTSRDPGIRSVTRVSQGGGGSSRIPNFKSLGENWIRAIKSLAVNNYQAWKLNAHLYHY